MPRLMTPEEEKQLQDRLDKTLKEIAQEPAEFWWGDTVRQVEHIHTMHADYSGCIVYLFARWYDKYGSCQVFFDTRTGCIDGSIADLTAREICDHDEIVSDYWETHFDSCK